MKLVLSFCLVNFAAQFSANAFTTSLLSYKFSKLHQLHLSFHRGSQTRVYSYSGDGKPASAETKPNNNIQDVDSLWDDAFTDEEDEIKIALNDSGGITRENIFSAFHHRSVHRKVFNLSRGGSSTKPLWQHISSEIQNHYPASNLMMLKSPARWLKGERKLVQLIKTSDLPEYDENSEDDNPSPHDTDSSRFEVGSHYKVKGIAGRGAFARVGWGTDIVTGEELAFKRVPDVMPDRTAARRLMREVSLLRRVRGHPNVLSIKDLLVRRWTGRDRSGAPRPVVEVFLISEFMPADLGMMLDSGFVFSSEQVASLTWQLLRALRHLHHCGVMHRDLKPGNVLVNKFWHLELCDLGIARTAGFPHDADPLPGDETSDRRFTDYVVTRPYRAPELLMGSREYGTAVDMWSAGCLLAELLAAQALPEEAPLTRPAAGGGPRRLPLFPGEDHRDMMRRIVGLLGHPPAEALARLAAWEPEARAFIDRLPYPACDVASRQEVLPAEVPAAPYCRLPSPAAPDEPALGVEWGAVFPWADPAALDLLARMLVFDPDRRITAAQALRHPFFAAWEASAAAAGEELREHEMDLAMRRACVRSKASWSFFWLKRDRLHRLPF